MMLPASVQTNTNMLRWLSHWKVTDAYSPEVEASTSDLGRCRRETLCCEGPVKGGTAGLNAGRILPVPARRLQLRDQGQRAPAHGRHKATGP